MRDEITVLLLEVLCISGDRGIQRMSWHVKGLNGFIIFSNSSAIASPSIDLTIDDPYHQMFCCQQCDATLWLRMKDSLQILPTTSLGLKGQFRGPLHLQARAHLGGSLPFPRRVFRPYIRVATMPVSRELWFTKCVRQG